MMNLIQSSLQTSITRLSTPETAHQWYATVDASQIPSTADIDWKNMARLGQWGNLLQGTPEGEELDLTCWLLPLTNDAIAWTTALASEYPYCCTWLQSAWTLARITRHWQKISNALLPNGSHALLRFYDPCVLLSLQQVLTSSQWQGIHAPCNSWLYINRTGTLAELLCDKTSSSQASQIRLNQEQLTALKNTNREDTIATNLIAQEHLAQDSNPFDNYQRIHAALNVLKQYGISDHDQQYQFCAQTLDWPLTHYQAPALIAQLQLLQQGKIDIDTVVAQYPNHAEHTII